MFERLATLVIELKERVTQLEEQMKQIEQKDGAHSPTTSEAS